MSYLTSMMKIYLHYWIFLCFMKICQVFYYHFIMMYQIEYNFGMSLSVYSGVQLKFYDFFKYMYMYVKS